jgi:hypothetical protein
MYKFIIALLFAAPVAYGETLIPPSEFEEMSEGKSMYFFQNGQFYGAEQFYKGRKSTWQFLDGQCSEGRWRAEQDAMCFTYEHNNDEQCWQMFRQTDGRVTVRGIGADPANDLDLRATTDGNLNCPGPAIGA